ncbi:MAG: sugar phosphate isomerase/epimerase family protein [Cytophagaceae bacterium]
MNSDRRTFLKNFALIGGSIGLSTLVPFPSFSFDEKPDLKISLAEWSLHKALFSGKIQHIEFPTIARSYGIDAVEYVNQFFKDKARDHYYLTSLKDRAEDAGVKSLLIMVDGEGSLADPDKNVRQIAVENHYKWVEAAKFLNCHSVRVNLLGSTQPEEWHKAAVDSLGKLGEYGQMYQINIIVENHGQLSSNSGLLVNVIKEVNNPFCGTLPDFGNFCLQREKGDLYDSPCVQHYDKYKGVEEMLPYAKGVSAKSFDFDSKGNETTIDFKKMLQLVIKSGYSGYIGIEYEGTRMSEEQGIRATKKLLEATLKELNAK